MTYLPCASIMAPGCGGAISLSGDTALIRPSSIQMEWFSRGFSASPSKIVAPVITNDTLLFMGLSDGCSDCRYSLMLSQSKSVAFEKIATHFQCIQSHGDHRAINLTVKHKN